MNPADTATSPDGPTLWTLDEISRLVSPSGNASETLSSVVNLIRRRFDTDVCSIYLLEPDRTNLVLAATIGLPESVARCMRHRCSGLVAQQLCRSSSGMP